MNCSKRSKRNWERGYTLVEVMMSLSVLALGASGVIAIQKATLAANTNARNLSTANTIAVTWLERLMTDAQMWRGLGNDITQTQWLKYATNTPGWFTPPEIGPPNTPSGSPSSDMLGKDIYKSTPSPPPGAFCTQLRLQTYPDADPNSDFRRVIRAQVRVFWDKSGKAIDCNFPDNVPIEAQARNQYGMVYMVSAIPQNTSGG